MIDKRCDNLNALLPWFVKSALSSAETVAIGQHVTICQQCQEDLLFLTTVSDRWTPALPSNKFLDDVWRRLQIAPSMTRYTYLSIGMTKTVQVLRGVLLPIPLWKQFIRLVWRAIESGLKHRLRAATTTTS